eukprot:CAMPEP_0181324220 /NCGR_PEP_ID=MMETSP1101-20121128/20233_1 /TAXON_ID=46948 /ORGANISM="Rhodomonas abbreviata, Strain Caron Lab Isolate" /LENGTH=57 /DNA_ID=CAMNT_0023432361 /DNA_START=8 /DNA_END=181 /DNA_ORIENTATION=+
MNPEAEEQLLAPRADMQIVASQDFKGIYCIDHRLRNLQSDLLRMDTINWLVQEDKAA